MTVSGVKAPTRQIPAALLYVVAAFAEIGARTAGKPALLSWATVQIIKRERSRFSHIQSKTELGISFRPIDTTLSDEIRWFRQHSKCYRPTPMSAPP